VGLEMNEQKIKEMLGSIISSKALESPQNCSEKLLSCIFSTGI
jgi:hypothetical protein